MIFLFLPGFTMDKSHENIIYLLNKFKQSYPKARYRVINPPIRKITIYKGRRYRAWYDYYSDYRDIEECINVNQFIESRKRIHSIINSYKSKKDIFLIGYSQGACQALDAGLTYPKQIGGIIGIKGHIPIHTFKDMKIKQNVWVTHGKKDKTIGFNVAKQSYDKLKYKTFLIQETSNHSLKSGINEQMKSINNFISTII